MPACWASAGVGQSVPHQRLAAGPPGSARGRGRRAAIMRRVDAGERTGVRGRVDPAGRRRRARSRPGRAAAKPSRRCVGRVAVEVLGEPGGLDAQTAAARRRARAARDAGRGSAARRGRCCAPARCSRSCTSRHQSHSSVGEGVGSGVRGSREAHGASSSGKCSAACSRSVSRTNWRSAAPAIR